MRAYIEMDLSQDGTYTNMSYGVVHPFQDQYQSKNTVSKRPIPGRPQDTTPAVNFFEPFSNVKKHIYYKVSICYTISI